MNWTIGIKELYPILGIGGAVIITVNTLEYNKERHTKNKKEFRR